VILLLLLLLLLLLPAVAAAAVVDIAAAPVLICKVYMCRACVHRLQVSKYSKYTALSTVHYKVAAVVLHS
jgi:hypothetical protein